MSAGIASGGHATSKPSAVTNDPVGEASVGDLLARAAAGAQSAWDEIVRRYERLVWSVARSHRLNSADSADAVQTTWLRLVEHMSAIQEPDRLGAWLATTARRESLRIVTRRQRERRDGADDELQSMPDSGIGVEESLLSSERDATLLRAVRELDDRCQRLLRVLSASPPPRYDAVSEAFGMPIGSIGPTRGRCLQRLKDVLLDMGFNPNSSNDDDTNGGDS
ncbi:RNA polymerase sigma factor [Angustibacter sp. McL0619]|uniref:RNA polymerase sigma factor n=1 Tax=Angustibacter sp. McL0619 TaxID=3415676 RepID=UPI003CF39F31